TLVDPDNRLFNYSITNAGSTFTIIKRVVTWTTNANSKTYGSADPVPLTTGSGTNFVVADGVTAVYTRAAGEDVGGYAFTATLHSTTLSDAQLAINYAITNTGSTFTINTKSVTVLTANAGKTYGDSDPSPLTTADLSGFLAGDNITATFSRAAGNNVAAYHITTTLVDPDSRLFNYSITNAGSTFTIIKRVVTWTTNANSKTYGSADPVPLTTGSGTNFVVADGVTAVYTRAAGEDVGGYAITATLHSTTLSDAQLAINYAITNTGSTFTITKAALTITADADPATPTLDTFTKVYDSQIYSPFTVRYSGLVNGDTS